ncbi:MAG: universal stress protein [Chloroflexota bacterium]
MIAEPHELTIRRILVALDASPHSLAALDAAVDLAVRFQAELAGLFVEDENLSRLAEYAFVHEIGLFSAVGRPVSGQEIARRIRVRVRHVRQVFTLSTSRARVRWSFRVTRGVVLSQVVAAAAESDLLILGRAGWSLLQRKRLGSTVRGLLPEPFRLALVIKAGTCIGVPLVAVYDGSAAADRALQAAVALRHGPQDGPPLLVLLLTESPEKAQNLQEKATARLAASDVPVRYRRLMSANMLYLADVLQTERCGTLILPARGAVLQNDILIALLENIELPIMLVT